MDDLGRPRRIVKHAAGYSKTAAEWFTRDEVGFWEKQAAELWELSKEARHACDQNIDDEIAESLLGASLCIIALDAIIASIKKRGS